MRQGDRVGTISPGILQLRAVLRGISPLIWRRLLVPSDTSIAQLHEVLQAAFGWEDMHLHRFEIPGREYGLSREGGIFFAGLIKSPNVGCATYSNPKAFCRVNRSPSYPTAVIPSVSSQRSCIRGPSTSWRWLR